MSRQPWNARFFASTRGQIVILLRRASLTVEELAQALHLTDNAVRAHLVTLERDGIVQQSGERRGNGKPASVYELAPEAEHLFPKAYGSVLRQLLDVLHEQLLSEDVESVLRKVGQRLAQQWERPRGDLRLRLEAAVEVLNELGGMAELEMGDGIYCIRGYSCPLAAAVPEHPEVCRLAEVLLSEIVGVPLHEQCDRHGSLHCRFTVSAP